MRYYKTGLAVLIVGAGIISFMLRPQVADPVRVMLANIQVNFPAMLLPQITVGGTVQPERADSHWYSPLYANDGMPLRFGYVQPDQAPAI